MCGPGPCIGFFYAFGGIGIFIGLHASCLLLWPVGMKLSVETVGAFVFRVFGVGLGLNA